MSSIYKLLKPKTEVEKGLIEIVSVYENNYNSIYLDGKQIQYLYKQEYTTTVITRSFIKKCVKASSVEEDYLHFVHYNLYGFGKKLLGQNYESNDYLDNYQGMKELIEKDIKQFKKSYFKDLAHGIENLEKKLGY